MCNNNCKNNSPFVYKWRFKSSVNLKKLLREYPCLVNARGKVKETAVYYSKSYINHNTNEEEEFKCVFKDRSILFTKAYVPLFMHLLIDGYVAYQTIDDKIQEYKTEFLYEDMTESSLDLETDSIINDYRIINTVDNRVLFKGPMTNEIAKRWKERKNIKVEVITNEEEEFNTQKL